MLKCNAPVLLLALIAVLAPYKAVGGEKDLKSAPKQLNLHSVRKESMPSAKTVTGKTFEYSGTLETGLTIFFKRPYKKSVTAEIVKVIRQEITNRSPVLMGANRQPLVADSVGETPANKYNETPQVMSYVLPLLVEEGFCTISDRKPFVIHKK